MVKVGRNYLFMKTIFVGHLLIFNYVVILQGRLSYILVTIRLTGLISLGPLGLKEIRFAIFFLSFYKTLVCGLDWNAF